MSKPPKAFRKEIFDKKTYNKEKFQYLVNNSDWGHFYGQLCAEGMFSIFTSIIENSLNKSIQKKKVFIRNDKSLFTIHQKWVSRKTKHLYRQLKQDMNPTNAKYDEIQSKFVENLNSALC